MFVDKKDLIFPVIKVSTPYFESLVDVDNKTFFHIKLI